LFPHLLEGNNLLCPHAYQPLDAKQDNVPELLGDSLMPDKSIP
jgi:hypothetical protein